MTILEMLNNKYENNKLMVKAFEIIKDNYTSMVNDNYELIVSNDGELNVKIPSLEKKDEFVYKSIGEYEYPLVMCMRITELKKSQGEEYILAKFLELYKDKLELFFKDVGTIDTLMDKIKKTKENIDLMTYVSMAVVILGVVALGIFSKMSQTLKNISILGLVIISVISIWGQFTKEKQVMKIIDAYISVIKTGWYKKELNREYAFLCNFIG